LTAARLFARIGVHLRFVYSRPEEADSGVITLHILDRAPRNVKPNVLGSAIIDPDAAPEAFIFCDRLIAFRGTNRSLDVGVLLGYAIAHEIGHLLRGVPGHSTDGIMKARWSLNDVRAMLRRDLAFTRDDSDRIRTFLASRRETVAIAARTK
jgi:hypothetical protein